MMDDGWCIFVTVCLFVYMYEDAMYGILAYTHVTDGFWVHLLGLLSCIYRSLTPLLLLQQDRGNVYF